MLNASPETQNATDRSVNKHELHAALVKHKFNALNAHATLVLLLILCNFIALFLRENKKIMIIKITLVRAERNID